MDQLATMTGSATAQNLKKTLEAFGEATSVKGVGRSLKSTGVFSKVLWLVSVIGGACIALCHLYIILNRYFSYDTVTKISQKYTATQFPDITLCKLNPLSHDLDNFYSLDDYLSIIEGLNMTEFEDEGHFQHSGGYTEETAQQVLAQMTSVSGYFQSIPLEMNPKTHRSEAFMTSCQFYDWEWRELPLNCFDVVASIHVNPNYYKCPTLSVPAKYRQRIRGVSLILYLHDFGSAVVYRYRHTPLESKAAGVRMHVHEESTLPQMKEGVTLPVGHEVTVRLTTLARKLLPKPYNNCTYKKYLEYKEDQAEELMSQKLELYKYTQSSCTELHAQEEVAQTCGCLSAIYGFTKKQIAKFRNMCANIDPDNSLETNDEFNKWLDEGEGVETLPTRFRESFIENFNQSFHRVLCTLENNSNPPQDLADINCPPSCNQLQYKLDISQAPWPMLTYQLAFWLDVIKGRSYEDHFEIYGQIHQQQMNEGFTDDVKAQLNNLSLIEDNFLQLNLRFEDQTVLVFEETPSLTVESLYANLGGLLNLWIGITFFTLVEIVELVYNLVHVSLGKNVIKGNKVCIKTINVHPESKAESSAEPEH